MTNKYRGLPALHQSITIRITRADYDRLEAIAHRRGTSLASQVRKWMLDGMWRDLEIQTWVDKKRATLDVEHRRNPW